jgi:hypothetical protein
MEALNSTSNLSAFINDIYKTSRSTCAQFSIDKILAELTAKINDFQTKAVPILRDYQRLQALGKGNVIKYDTHETLFVDLSLKTQSLTEKQTLETIKREIRIREQRLIEILDSRDKHLELFKYFNDNKERLKAQIAMNETIILT